MAFPPVSSPDVGQAFHGVLKLSMPVPHPGHEFAFVPRAISSGDFPLALNHVVLEFPLVHYPIFKLHSTLSVKFACYHLACVYVPVLEF